MLARGYFLRFVFAYSSWTYLQGLAAPALESSRLFILGNGSGADRDDFSSRTARLVFGGWAFFLHGDSLLLTMIDR